MRPAAGIFYSPTSSSPFAPLEPELPLLELLERIDWEEITVRLIGYARFRLSRHGSAAARYALQPEDCVQESIRRLLDETRNFDRGTESDLFRVISGIIDSLISHEGEKSRRRGRHFSIRSDGQESLAPDEIREGVLDDPRDPVVELEVRDDLKRFVASLDSELAFYYQFRADAPDLSAEERAPALGTTVQDIRNKDRRLKRHRAHWLNHCATPKGRMETS
jgi:hypothetical protein